MHNASAASPKALNNKILNDHACVTPVTDAKKKSSYFEDCLVENNFDIQYLYPKRKKEEMLVLVGGL